VLAVTQMQEIATGGRVTGLMDRLLGAFRQQCSTGLPVLQLRSSDDVFNHRFEIARYHLDLFRFMIDLICEHCELIIAVLVHSTR